MEQKPKTNKARDLVIGFFGWFLISILVFSISNLLFYWELLIPVVTIIVIGILLFMKRKWFAYGIIAAIIANVLIFILIGFLLGNSSVSGLMKFSLEYGLKVPFFMVGGFY